MCNFQYASVVSEPEYSEYNKYPVEFVDSGTTIQEDYFYENKVKTCAKNEIAKLLAISFAISFQLLFLVAFTQLEKN